MHCQLSGRYILQAEGYSQPPSQTYSFAQASLFFTALSIFRWSIWNSLVVLYLHTSKRSANELKIGIYVFWSSSNIGFAFSGYVDDIKS